MGKLLGGAVALGVAAAGSLVIAAPGWGQEEPEPEFEILGATLSPTEVTAGELVTVTSVDACSLDEGVVTWALFAEGEYSWDDPDSGGFPLLSGFQDLNSDGSWSVTFDPTDRDPDEGEVDGEDALLEEFDAAAVEEEDPGEDPADPFTFQVYGPLGFSLDGTGLGFFAACIDLSFPDTLLDELAPEQVQSGETVTVSSIDPCPAPLEGTSLYWDLWSITDDETGDIEFIEDGYVELGEDGHWEIALTAPAETGFYVVFGLCETADGEWTGFYDGLVFEVGEAGEPPAEPPTRPEGPHPARPIVREPEYNG